jgi:hypothetical protein
MRGVRGEKAEDEGFFGLGMKGVRGVDGERR